MVAKFQLSWRIGIINQYFQQRELRKSGVSGLRSEMSRWTVRDTPAFFPLLTRERRIEEEMLIEKFESMFRESEAGGGQSGRAY